MTDVGDGGTSDEREVRRLRDELRDATNELTKIRRSQHDPKVAADLLMLFGRVAGIILLAAVALTAILAIFRPGVEISGLTSLLNTQLSLIIGAILGYAAHPEGGSDR